MKLERLELKHWGHFEQLVLDLAGAAGRFHVVLGDNEAGKSTTRRAISALLYGVPRGAKDSFRFDPKKLALGATLTWADGSTVTFTRLKTRDAILGPDGKALAIPRLTDLVTRVPLDRFELEHSLDQVQLRDGARALLEGKGEAGQGLLAAGMGGFNAKKALKALDDRAEEIFLARGKKRLNQLLSEYETKSDEAKTACVDPKRVKQLRDDLAEDARELEEGAGLERTLLNDKAFLDKVITARPVIGALAELRARLTTLARSPVVSASFAERRKSATGRLGDAQQQIPGLEQRKTRLEGQLQGPQPDGEVLLRASEITVLSNGVDRHLQDVEKVRSSKQDLAEAEQSVLSAARGVGLTAEQLLAVRSGALELHEKTLKGLRDKQQTVHDDVGRLQGELDEVTQSLGEAQGSLARLPPGEEPKFIERLQAFVSDAPDRVWGTMADEVRKAGELAKKAFSEVAGWTGTQAALLEAKLPEVRDCDDHEEALKVEDKLDDLHGELETARSALDAAREAEERLVSHGPPPTAEGVAIARDERQRGWFLVRDTLEGRSPAESTVAAWTGGQSLVVAYEHAVRKADAVSDERTQGSDRVAKLAAAKEKTQDAERTVKGLERKLATLEKKQSAAVAAWIALWSEAGVAAGTPKGMRSWLGAVTKFRESASAAKKKADEFAAFQQETLQAVAPLAARLGLVATDHGTLAALREASRLRIAAQEQQIEQRRSANEAVAGLAKKQKRLTDSLATAKAALEKWEKDREGLAAALGRPSTANVEVLDAILKAAQKAEIAEVKREGAQRLLDAATKNVEDFERRVQVLVKALGLPDAPVPVQVSQAMQKLTDARKLLGERETISAELKSVTAELESAKKSLEAVEAELKALAVEAGTSVPTELDRIEADNQARVEVEKALELANSKLDGLGAGVAGGVDALQQAVVAQSDLVVQRRGAEIDAALAELAGRRAELNGKKALREQELAGFAARGDEAVRKEAECESLRARIAEDAREYLRLQYARQYLADAIERYRKEHQGPVLSKASEYFRKLTRGSFTELIVQPAEDKKPLRLQGVRVVEGQPEEVEVEDMSEGTRDELFLSLRLATLDVAVSAGEPLPVIVDDTLVNLCDGRARVAMELLFELSKKTQVLIFTHHASVAELAKAVAGQAMGLTKLPGDDERLKAATTGEAAA